MDIRVLHYFLEVAKEGNFTRAAEKLHITQPTLSRQIMDLEEEVGAKLLNRGKRKVSLTEAGMVYHKRVVEIVGLYKKAALEVAGVSEELGGHLSIGCVETNAASYLMDKVTAFAKDHPKVQYEFYNGFSDDIKDRLDRGLLDFGILIEPVEAAKYDFFHLNVKEAWGVVVPKNHPLAEKGSVTVDDIKIYPLMLTSRSLVVDQFESWLGDDWATIKVFCTLNLMTNILPLIEKNQGILLTVDGAYTMREKESLVFIPLNPLRYAGHVVAWKKNAKHSQLMSKFLQTMND